MNIAPLVTVLVAVLAVVAMLWSEARMPRLEWFFKPLASLCFVALALQAGALEAGYGQMLLAGLLLCLSGDVLLIPDNDRTFVLGLGSFLLGHLAYALAFLQLPTNPYGVLASLLPVIALGVLSLRWLWPQLPPAMKGPVTAYIVVICGMLLMAGGSWGAPPALLILAGAWGFALSDLSVARNQFVRKSMANRFWGIPLYFASQMLLAWSVSTIA